MQTINYEIFGTLGPACADRVLIIEMADAGMTGMRLNLSHTSLPKAEGMLKELTAANEMLIDEGGKPLDLLIDLNGPELRVAEMTKPKELLEGEVYEIPFKENVLPLLKEGQTQNLISNKIQDLDLPTISIINEGKASKGSQGSEWQVFKVVKEGDKEIERVFDHQTIYQGHTPTAFEDENNTYIDEDGVLQTRRFIETKKAETTERRNSSITTARRENSIQSIAPTERGIVVEATPGGGSVTGQPQ
jgi:hypothetical protein